MSRTAKLKPARTVDDPRVKKILANLNRIMSSSERDATGSLEGATDALLGAFSMHGWPDDAIRAVLLAITTHCPKEDLGIFEEWSADGRQWAERWEVKQRYFRITGKDFPDEVNEDAFYRAMAGEDTPSKDATESENAEVH